MSDLPLLHPRGRLLAAIAPSSAEILEILYIFCLLCRFKKIYIKNKDLDLTDGQLKKRCIERKKNDDNSENKNVSV